MAFTAICHKIDADTPDLGRKAAMKIVNIPEPLQNWITGSEDHGLRCDDLGEYIGIVNSTTWEAGLKERLKRSKFATDQDTAGFDKDCARLRKLYRIGVANLIPVEASVSAAAPAPVPAIPVIADIDQPIPTDESQTLDKNWKVRNPHWVVLPR